MVYTVMHYDQRVSAASFRAEALIIIFSIVHPPMVST